jgi:hypothetical protein
MVRGLQRFQDHFRDYRDQFVLIGGTACDVLMAEAGLAFRATKDLDIVLLAETLTPDFGRAFWDFIRQGGYVAREREAGGKQYYRFARPANPGFPVLLELFSRVPDGLRMPAGSSLTPVPVGDAVSSLSAILLDEAYYGFLKSGRREVQGLPVLGAGHLMVLKAKAWLDLSARKGRGERVDAGDILKHKRDVFRLLQIAEPDARIDLPGDIDQEMQRFLEAMLAEGVELATLGIRSMGVPEAVEAIRALFRRG